MEGKKSGKVKGYEGKGKKGNGWGGKGKVKMKREVERRERKVIKKHEMVRR